MATEEVVKTQSSMQKVILFATVVSGLVAAYLMYRRGVPVCTIAKSAVTIPLGSLMTGVKNRV
jgi:hypothetical protein